MLWVFSTVSVAVTPLPPSVTSNDTTKSSVHNVTTPNKKSPGTSVMAGWDVDSSMIQRALYVLIGITVIGLLYFLVRAVRLKKPTQRKKYGLLSDYDENMEMAALESDEDETVYEARSLRR